MKIKITTTIDVHDEAALRAFAIAQLKRCWDMDDEQIAEEYPDTPTLALEALLLSNMNPSPIELGFEFVTHDAQEIE